MARFSDCIHARQDFPHSVEADVTVLVLDQYLVLPRPLSIYVDKAPTTPSELVYGTIAFDPIDHPDKVVIYFKTGSYPHLAIAHELGHAFDLAVNQFPGRLAYRNLFSKWREAVVASDEYKELQDETDEDATPKRLGFLMYALSFEECWARSFSQLFAGVHASSELNREFSTYISSPTHRLMKWGPRTFKPIAKAMLDIFRELNVLVKESGFPDDISR